MLFGDVIAIALSIIGFLFSLQGLWLVCRALWPARVQAATVRCRENGVASFFLGLPVMVATLVVAVGIGKRLGTFGILAGLTIGLLLLIYSSIGTAGLATHLGERLASPVDADRPWRATVRGGVVLEMAFLIPIVGWLGLLPISLIMGAGAMTLTLFRAKPAAPPPRVTSPVVPGAAFGAAVATMRPLYSAPPPPPHAVRPTTGAPTNPPASTPAGTPIPAPAMELPELQEAGR